MKFLINPIIDGKATQLQVERVYSDDRLEHFKVIGRNKSIILQTNRLLFAERGLKHRRGQWKIIDGTLHNTYAFEKITDAIDGFLNNSR